MRFKCWNYIWNVEILISTCEDLIICLHAMMNGQCCRVPRVGNCLFPYARPVVRNTQFTNKKMQILGGGEGCQGRMVTVRIEQCITVDSYQTAAKVFSPVRFNWSNFLKKRHFDKVNGRNVLKYSGRAAVVVRNTTPLMFDYNMKQEWFFFRLADDFFFRLAATSPYKPRGIVTWLL